jgi:hypothetical protein
MALLLFIHAEKLLHSHSKEHNNSHSQASVVIKANSLGCAICDFQLSKDASLPVCEFSEAPRSLIFKNYHLSSAELLYRDYRSFEGRGPPSML